jgi:hypothetical protein
MAAKAGSFGRVGWKGRSGGMLVAITYGRKLNAGPNHLSDRRSRDRHASGATS